MKDGMMLVLLIVLTFAIGLMAGAALYATISPGSEIEFRYEVPEEVPLETFEIRGDV